jgi:D-alanine-D-alanine ligase
MEMMNETTNQLNALQEQEQSESDKPPSKPPQLARPWRVAVVANVKGETALPINAPEDAGAEFDKKETIQAIQSAIESSGHQTIFLSADATLPYTLRESLPDICFNISEGIGGDAREAQVPALMELLRIPYTASRVMTSAISLDKTMTKRIWQQMGLPTARFQEFVTGRERLDRNLRYPLFVKPAREGTGMGMGSESIIYSEGKLRRRIAWVIHNYHQPALVEEFLPGREFTVAVLGRPDAQLYSRLPELYRQDGFHRFPVLEVESSRCATPGVYGNYTKTLHFGDAGIPSFICPAQISPELSEQLNNLAISAHQAIGALDVSRVDIRMDAQGQPRLLEINTLPGLTPDFSDLCVIAKAGGLSYRELIMEILNLGASRFGLMPVNTHAEAEPIKLPALPELVPVAGSMD